MINSTMSSKNKMVLGYWDFRGFGEACRYMLEYTGAEYEDRQFIRHRVDDYSSWMSVRESVGLDFPNLPFLIDGERKLTECLAILKYLGRKNGLVPETEDEIIRADILEGVSFDIRTLFYRSFFSKNTFYRPNEFSMEYAEKFMEEIFKPKVEKIVKSMGNRKWVVGDKLTYLDFFFYTILSQIKTLFPEALNEFQRLQDYVKNFQALPAIDAYLKSGRFQQYPEHDPYMKTAFRDQKKVSDSSGKSQ